MKKSDVLSAWGCYRPIHISIVGGEPLVRWRELDALLPKLDAMKVEVQLVTSAVRPLPAHWSAISALHLVVSVDGLAEEHDRRREPATYDRILKHIDGHSVIVHCTITGPMLRRDGYLHDFADFWSRRPEARKIWFSLFTPQEDEWCEERLTTVDRQRAIEQLTAVAAGFPKVHMPRAVLDGYLRPPETPDECIFAQSTVCVSADLKTRVTPCQFGGKPVCAECGCMASSGPDWPASGRYALAGLVPISALFSISRKIGSLVGEAA